jgi:RsiW-degrading membrane proteinase PrsW (M82 family)
METGPPEKRLQMAPFTIHATRGLLRDRKLRRVMMAITVALALIMLVTGVTVFRSSLDPHEHPWRCVLFWFACAWQTLLAILLALFDVLVVRADARRARKGIREQVSNVAAETTSSQPDDT